MAKDKSVSSDEEYSGEKKPKTVSKFAADRKQLKKASNDKSGGKSKSNKSTYWGSNKAFKKALDEASEY